ncbi:MAG: inositol monophosphatase family protein [Anaerolineae bacterium]
MLATAINLVRAAGDLLRQGHYNGSGRAASKSSAVDLVTEYDLASERLITAGLRQHFPDYAILGEEGDHTLPAAGPVWVIDPVDGTTNFAHGFPVFSISLALLVDRQPELGVVYDPLRDDLFWAQRGQGAWRGERRLQVAPSSSLESSLLATGFPYDRASNADNNLAEFSYFMPRTRGVRRAGSAALDMAWVAAGWVNGYWERGVQVWDMAAAVLMVSEAGGLVTTYSGRPWQPGDRTVVGAHSTVHALLLNGIAEARGGRHLPMLE